jgi:hypothetical protein
LGNNNEKLGLAERLSTAKINQQQQYIWFNILFTYNYSE